MSRDRHEHMTLDVVLLQDMVWHVVIDFIDINYMMFLSNPTDGTNGIADKALVKEFAAEFDKVRVATGIFIALALFFHQQSFPSCSVVASDEMQGKDNGASKSRSIGTLDSSRPSLASHATGTLSGQSSEDIGGASDGYPSTGYRTTWAKNAGGGGARSHQEQIADVVKARKRSAIVSIILVDLPFFAIRIYMWSLSMAQKKSLLSTTPAPPISGTGLLQAMYVLESDDSGGSSMLDKWMVKNMLCMLLQAMQLRFVQQADLERSQSLQWWERGGQSKSSDVATGRSRLRRTMQDPGLRQIWQEMDRSKLDAAYEAAGGELGPEDTPTTGNERDDQASEEVPSSPAGASTGQSNDRRLGGSTGQGEQRHPARRWCFCCCCCCRATKKRGRCRCWSCDCSHSVMLHAVMGLVLGWLIAKVDFTQAFTDLVLGLGWQTQQA